MKNVIGTLSVIVTLWLSVSAAPDAWIYMQTEARLRALETLEVRTSAQVEANRQENESHLLQHNADAVVIARELENVSLLTEEYFQSLSRKIDIRALEQQIQELTNAIAIEQSEFDRLERINNGNTAAPPSDESLRAQARSRERIASLNARLSGAVRELNRLMIP